MKGKSVDKGMQVAFYCRRTTRIVPREGWGGSGKSSGGEPRTSNACVMIVEPNAPKFSDGDAPCGANPTGSSARAARQCPAEVSLSSWTEDAVRTVLP